MTRFLLLPLAFFLLAGNICALDIDTTGKEVGAYLGLEYNRNFYYYGELSIIGAVELNNRYTIKGGFSFGKTEYDTDIKSFIGARFNPLTDKPLNLSFSYIYNGLPEYDAHVNTLLPVVSYNTGRAGITIGTNFRLTSFLVEPAVFESMLAFSGYVNFINNEDLCIGISCANFDDFSAGNMGAYSLILNVSVCPNRNWSIINDIKLMQSGSVGLSANYYGLAWRGGARFKW